MKKEIFNFTKNITEQKSIIEQNKKTIKEIEK